jgi:hypothetical protein
MDIARVLRDGRYRTNHYLRVGYRGFSGSLYLSDRSVKNRGPALFGAGVYLDHPGDPSPGPDVFCLFRHSPTDPVYGDEFQTFPPCGGVITLSLNAGAYIAEIFRGGILAVDAGQMEAARSLGLSHYRTMFKIILPQAIRVSIPSLVNQFIISLKDTSIILVISLGEIVYEAKIYIT